MKFYAHSKTSLRAISHPVYTSYCEYKRFPFKRFLMMLLTWLSLSQLMGCTTLEYYEYLEPQRHANEQLIDIPYVYSGVLKSIETQHDLTDKQFHFSGVLLDKEYPYLEISVSTALLTPSKFLLQAESQSIQEENRKVRLSNSPVSLFEGEQALLVINPSHPFGYESIKADPQGFFEKYFLREQFDVLNPTDNGCPAIVLVQLDMYDEELLSMEISECQVNPSKPSETQLVWHFVDNSKIENEVHHHKPFGYQIGYLGFLITLPIDAVVTPFYALGWGILSSRHLIQSSEE